MLVEARDVGVVGEDPGPRARCPAPRRSPPAPWSVPCDSLLSTRRPNSDHTNVSTRSAEAAHLEVGLERGERLRQRPTAPCASSLRLVVVGVVVAVGLDGRSTRTPSGSASSAASPRELRPEVVVLRVGDGRRERVGPSSLGCVGRELRRDRAGEPRARAAAAGPGRDEDALSASRPHASPPCRRRRPRCPRSCSRASRGLFSEATGAPAVRSDGRQRAAERQALQRVVGRARPVQPAPEPARPGERAQIARSPRSGASGSARGRGWRSRSRAGSRSCRLEQAAHAAVDALGQARRAARGRLPSRPAASRSRRAAAQVVQRAGLPSGGERRQQVAAAGQEDVDEDGRVRRGRRLGLRGLQHAVERHRLRGVERQAEAESAGQHLAAAHLGLSTGGVCCGTRRSLLNGSRGISAGGRPGRRA